MSSRRASLRSENCPIWIGISVRQLLELVSDFIGIRKVELVQRRMDLTRQSRNQNRE